jgi:hypothetical protein
MVMSGQHTGDSLFLTISTSSADIAGPAKRLLNLERHRLIFAKLSITYQDRARPGGEVNV